MGTNFTRSTLEQKLRRIFKKFPANSGKCNQCAAQVFILLTKSGMDASIVHLQTHLPFLATRHGIQLARRIGKDLAYHTVVQSGERVFDALTGAEGMQWQDYQNLFYENAFEDGTIQIVRNLDKEEGDDQ